MPGPTASPSDVVPSMPPATPATPAPTGSGAVVKLGFDPVLQRDDVELTAAMAFEGGFVVGGCVLFPPEPATEGPCERALVLVSRDGASWDEVVLPDAAQRRIVGLAETPLGLLAFGRTQESEPPMHRAMWRSGDGETWEPFVMEAPSSIVFEMAAALDGGRSVLIGSDTAYDLAVQTEAWATVDGRTWTTGSTPLSPKVVAHPGLVAVGDECVDLCPPDARPRVFRSVDGLTWTEDELPAEMSRLDATGLASQAGRAIVAGLSSDAGPYETSVWFDDPAGWRGTVLGETAEYPTVTIMPAAGGLIVIADDASPGPAMAWWSADGRSWIAAQLDGIDDGFITASAGDETGIVIVDFTSIWTYGG
ncbi:MAG TPA: hypothetical protein VFX65_08360 [Candidatus Limnocylindrales bacterium]|nr:hypothetical protein [Candidatus Limnocylindrales bacterium]